MRILFFGCWDRAGHFLHEPGGRTLYDNAVTPWGNRLDACLCPGFVGPQAWKTPQVQPEGHAALHHAVAKGVTWTAVSFWDRSVDHRMNCNAAFLVDEAKTFEEVMALAKAHFPEVMARFRFCIRVVSG